MIARQADLLAQPLKSMAAPFGEVDERGLADLARPEQRHGRRARKGGFHGGSNVRSGNDHLANRNSEFRYTVNRAGLPGLNSWQEGSCVVLLLAVGQAGEHGDEQQA